MLFIIIGGLKITKQFKNLISQLSLITALKVLKSTIGICQTIYLCHERGSNFMNT